MRTGFVSCGVVVIITTFVGETIKKKPVKPAGVDKVIVPLPSVLPVGLRTYVPVSAAVVLPEVVL